MRIGKIRAILAALDGYGISITDHELVNRRLKELGEIGSTEEPDVVIEVKSGIPTPAKIPQGCIVIIKDYDIEGLDVPNIREDDLGRYIELNMSDYKSHEKINY